jgi:hypothetical protein
MKTSTIRRRACLVAAGSLVVVLASASPSMAAPVGHSRPALQQDPDLRQQPNPLGFQDLASPEQEAEEGTLSQGPSEVDAEVGAGEHDIADVASSAPRQSASSAPQHSARGDWVVQGLVILLFLAVVSISMRAIFKPSDQIPRTGGVRSDA